MEYKQLNFNRPLLSVRRTHKNDRTKKNESFTPTKPPVALFKPELKSGPVMNPGSVPFVWEHSPGRPKDETSKQSQADERPLNAPKLPPGRILKPKNQDLDVKTEDTNVTEALTIDPFGSKVETLKETKEERAGSGDVDDDDIDETYMDALDTLSRGESLFYNSSLSGVSGLESDVKPSRGFSTDPKTHDFMMNRFLPAAKAMASDVPQHTPKKYPVEEKPKPPPWEVKKLVNNDSTKPQLRYGPNFLQDINHGNDEHDSDYDYDEPGRASYKVCGLLPRFCLKGSFNILNSVPGLSVRTRSPIFHANRTRASSSSASSFSETENEPARVAIYEHRSLGESHLAKHEKDENKSTERKELSLLKKGLTSFKELLADEDKKEKDPPQSLAVEKTLYIDTVHKVESPEPNSDFIICDTDVLKPLQIASESVQSEISTETQTVFSKDGKDEREHEHTLTNAEEMIGDVNKEQNWRVSRGSLSELPAPPPLPKSPSDSWLWRTLPSKHTSSVCSNRKYPSSDVSLIDQKSQLRYSQGLLFPIPET